WQWWEWRHDPDSQRFTVTLEYLYPGEGVAVYFATITDTEPLPFGLIFTNTAEVTLDPDDTNPTDNTDEVVLTAGPDLYVEKELVAGELKPGELITFSLRFGNDRQGHEWWWDMQGNAWITETLPAGLTFITSTQHWCGAQGDWCPMAPQVGDGGAYGWHVGSLSAGEWNEIHLTVQITDTATGLDTFTNTCEIASDQPISDTEPYYHNNLDIHVLPIALPYFDVAKAYESSRVAGTPVTYTLQVTNTGHAVATSVVLSDSLPAGLTYGGGDGTFDGSDVTWSFDLGAGWAVDKWFSATLPCSGTVSNDAYSVVSSFQGVTSTAGPPVDFAVLAPALSAGFDQSAASVVVSEMVAFTDTSTTDGPAISEWLWDFGDGGAQAVTPDASHQYTGAGIFTVTLTITDSCGYGASHASTLTVQSGAVASFTASPTMGVAPLNVVFTNTSSGGYTTSLWAFGDEVTSTEESPTHTYAAGVYTVSLTLDAGLPGSDTLTRTNYITACHLADIDCDCAVDIADVQAVAGNWRCAVGDGCYDERQDLDGDGVITVIDIMKVAAHWGWTCGGSVTAAAPVLPPWWDDGR
ncbi:MAG: PKD domain-containing protein, partial [Anaerolineae bacterium]